MDILPGCRVLIYHDWTIDCVCLIAAAQSIVREFLKTFEEFPPRMKPTSFTVDDVLKKMEQGFES